MLLLVMGASGVGRLTVRWTIRDELTGTAVCVEVQAHALGPVERVDRR